MRIPCENERGSKLHIHLDDYFYSITLYQDFESKEELDDFVKRNHGCNRNQYEYYYG